MASVEFSEQVVSLLSSALPLFFFLLFLYKWLSANPSITGKNLPPSPPKLPIIGNLHQMGTRAHRSLQALSQTYGDLMFLQLGSKPTIVISSAKVASQAFKTFDVAFSGRTNISAAGRLFYKPKDLVFAPYGEHWRHMRSVSVLQLLTNNRVRSFNKVREEELALMIEKIKRSPLMVNLTDMFGSLTRDVICRAAFGRKYNGEKDSIDFQKLLDELAHLFGSCNVEDVLPWMAWINWFNGFNAKVNKIGTLFDDLLERIVRDHEDRVKETRDGSVDNIGNVKDFVDILLELQRDENTKNKAIDKESIKGAIMDTFAAGTHTTYLAMVWTFTEILRHPTVMKQLQQEVRGITAEKEWVAPEDLEKMTYLKAVIKESLRLHPPLLFLVPRETIEDVKLNGYHIPAGTQVLTNVWAIGRDPASWENPENFIPERFVNSTIDFKGHDFQLIPFGAGRRGCPGISFATVTVELVLANLIHQFDWTLPVGVERETLDITESPGLAHHKETPLLVVASPRFK